MPVHVPNENYITYQPIANMAQVLSDHFFTKQCLLNGSCVIEIIQVEEA
jgi:hypothetical protein